MIEDFMVMWQPIVHVDNAQGLAPLTIVAGQLQIHPPQGRDLATWWSERIAAGDGERMQALLEASLFPFLSEMGRAYQWHIPVHPQVPPTTRSWMPLWLEQRVPFNLVYELPVDEPIDPAVWAELELIRREPTIGRHKPSLAGTHVGRKGLTPALAETLNAAPFDVLLLDPVVAQGLKHQMDLAMDDVAPLQALREFLDVIRPDLPVVVTGIERSTQWQAAYACGALYGQGALWMPPTPLADTFTAHVPETDPLWYPDKVYQTAEGWVAARGMTFVVRP
ncbi:hypothetical protein [Sulfobacillus thermosulfidooxidans]|uniref:hypothetical protein n=1 Tax=Sulfobacillus thermosulfidooxidans TaxID=28034 RepID=UPI0002F0E6F9|nr:hypothetical protein [Sulfobacillus thermosulfidooxidans]